MLDLQSADLASTDADRQRWFTYMLIVAVAAGNGFARIASGGINHPTHGVRIAPTAPQVPIFSANDRSRWCTVWSLVELGTYQIDAIIQEPGWDTIDKGRFQDHFYSSKPPFLSTIVAALYWCLKRALGFDLLEEPHVTAPVILLIVNWVPSLVALVLVAAIGERYARSIVGRIYLVFAMAAGTFLTTFLTTLNNHTLAANGVVFSIYPMLRILNDNKRSKWLFASAGFWSSFVACCELPAAAFGLAVFGLLVRRDPRRTWTSFVPAAIIPLALFFYTNWLCTAGIFPFYASFGSPNDTFYKYVHNGVPSYWSNATPLDRGESSSLVYLMHCTIGHHGIFSLSPIFFLTIAGWTRLGTAHPLRVVGWMGLLLTVWVIDFYLLQAHSYNYGGSTSGLRWVFWLIPMWLLALVPTFDHWGGRRGFQLTAAILLLLSIFSASCPHENPWQHPWLMHVLNSIRD